MLKILRFRTRLGDYSYRIVDIEIVDDMVIANHVKAVARLTKESFDNYNLEKQTMESARKALKRAKMESPFGGLADLVEEAADKKKKSRKKR